MIQVQELESKNSDTKESNEPTKKESNDLDKESNHSDEKEDKSAAFSEFLDEAKVVLKYFAGFKVGGGKDWQNYLEPIF